MEFVMSLPANQPEVEVSSKPIRRRYSAEYKRKIKWRKAAERREVSGLTPKKRGPKTRVIDARDRESSAKNREIAGLKKRIERAEVMLEIQKKFSQLMGITLPPPPSEDEDTSTPPFNSERGTASAP